MDTLLEMLGSFAIAMLMPRWLIVTCALVGTLAVLWGMTGIALFTVHKLSGWLLSTFFGVASGVEPEQRAPITTDSDIATPADEPPNSMKPTKPSAPVKLIEKHAGSVLPEGKSLQQRLTERGVGKGAKLKVTLPKRAWSMTESEKTKPSTRPPTRYPLVEESWELRPEDGTYSPAPPYLGSVPSKSRQRRKPRGS